MTREKKNLFHQRKKGESITYDGSVEPILLPPGNQEGPNKLTLKIKASPKDWNKLYLLAEADSEYLGRLILLHITRPVYEKFLAREESHLLRGLHKEVQQIFMEKARMYAAAAFAVISHWAKSPLTIWPDDLKAVIREAGKILGEASIWPPKKQSPKKESIDVIAMVRYLLDLKYGRRGNELSLDNVEHMDNEIFRKIYLDKNKIEAAKAIQDNCIQEYGRSPSIDTLYKFVPGFGWELIKD